MESEGSDWYELAETGPDVVWESWNFADLDDFEESGLSEERKEKMWKRIEAELF